MRVADILPFLAVVLIGCAAGNHHPLGGKDAEATVVFPPVQLRSGEYIETFKVRIKGGRVLAIHRIPDDWDIALARPDGGCVVISGEARHFSAGLSSSDRLNGFIALQADADARIQAVLTTEGTDSPGGEGRKIPFRRLAATPGRPGTVNRNGPAKLEPPFRISGAVRDSTTGQAIPDFLVTPRYAFANRTPPVFGAWDEYEGERFYRGNFQLSYDRQLLVGSLEKAGWQFRIEAEGYEPLVTPVLENEVVGAKLDCQLTPLAVRPPVQ